MEGKSANNFLKYLFEAHQIAVIETDGWLYPNSQLPAIQATCYNNQELERLLLQIKVYIEEGQILEECFAGFPTENGLLMDAFHNFTVNSFHVLISAFWQKQDSCQIDKETWVIGEAKYSVYIGPFGNRGNVSITPRVPENAFIEIEGAIKKSDANERYYWFRTFFANLGNDETIYEALKNNEHWEEGLQALKAQKWEKSSTYYSTRNFVLAIKQS